MKVKDLVSKDKMIVVMDNLGTTIDAEESQRINNVEVSEGLKVKLC